MKSKLTKRQRTKRRGDPGWEQEKKGSQPRSMIIDGKKKCSACKEMLAVEMFAKDKRAATGLECRCKLCGRAWHRERAAIGETKIYAKQYRAAHPDIIQKKNKKYAKKYPHKVRANDILNRFLNRGEITRCPCEVCSSSNVQAHHYDYQKPIDVNWFCDVHHKAWHRVFQPEGLNYAQTN